MKLIGLMGNKGVGKTVGAMHLVNKYQFVEKPLAECLKRACKELFLLTDDQLYGTLEQKEEMDERWFNCSPRQMLQFVGTDLLRNQLDQIIPGLGLNVFIHHFKLWYESAKTINPEICVVVSDIRFQNEAQLIRDLGGIVIKINRNTPNNDKHISEIELQTIAADYTIQNDDTFEDFFGKIDYIVENI